MYSSLKVALDHIRQFEGGFVWDKDDPGGATNMGITLATFRRYEKQNATVSDLRRMTWETASALYEHAYWNAVKGSELPAGLDLCVFDMAVNAGPSLAIRLLQRIVEEPADVVMGYPTMAAIVSRDPVLLIQKYLAIRLEYYQKLKGWQRFGRGWTRRANAAADLGLQLARGRL